MKCCLVAEYLAVVILEFLDAGIGQRMLEHRHQDFIRNGRDIRAGKSAVGDMDRCADAGGNDLGIDVGITENGNDLIDQVDASLVDIIKSA